MTAGKILAALCGVGGTVMRSSFDKTKEALREALAGVRAATSEVSNGIPARRQGFQWR